ncbi:MAG: effector-associated domain EAD1-containing protein [Anaerolineae bacterium]|nr:effector-associated domain EAD1-containing protein [Anaerolineae bacterium]
MKLALHDLRLLREALLDAFNRESFSIMLRGHLGIQLSDHASNSGFTTIVNETIAWAERNDQINSLVAGAKAEVPTNRKIQALPDAFTDSGPRTTSETDLEIDKGEKFVVNVSGGEVGQVINVHEMGDLNIDNRK